MRTAFIVGLLALVNVALLVAVVSTLNKPLAAPVVAPAPVSPHAALFVRALREAEETGSDSQQVLGTLPALPCSLHAELVMSISVVKINQTIYADEYGVTSIASTAGYLPYFAAFSSTVNKRFDVSTYYVNNGTFCSSTPVPTAYQTRTFPLGGIVNVDQLNWVKAASVVVTDDNSADITVDAYTGFVTLNLGQIGTATGTISLWYKPGTATLVGATGNLSAGGAVVSPSVVIRKWETPLEESLLSTAFAPSKTLCGTVSQVPARTVSWTQTCIGTASASTSTSTSAPASASHSSVGAASSLVVSFFAISAALVFLLF